MRKIFALLFVTLLFASVAYGLETKTPKIEQLESKRNLLCSDTDTFLERLQKASYSPLGMGLIQSGLVMTLYTKSNQEFMMTLTTKTDDNKSITCVLSAGTDFSLLRLK